MGGIEMKKILIFLLLIILIGCSESEPRPEPDIKITAILFNPTDTLIWENNIYYNDLPDGRIILMDTAISIDQLKIAKPFRIIVYVKKQK